MYDLIVIGGGPAGLAAAHSAWEEGLSRILVVERDREPGGILNQCIHSGFGLHYFKEELTGPEYAGRFLRMLSETGVELWTDTTVLELTQERRVHMVSPALGYRVEEAGSVILAMGCRERTRGALSIPGTRPAGVLTAGAAQRYVNIEGYLPGRRVVILGSGDIGLIMARRMTLEGCKVQAVMEICPFSNGLTRNMVQCLYDYDIPLYLSHTITAIHGKDRVNGITAAKVDDHMKPIPGTEFDIDCDTLLLSVGLIPENELSRGLGLAMHPLTNGPIVDQHRETSIPGIFAAGNVVHVHDLVDFVSEEAEIAGKYAALKAQEQLPEDVADVKVEAIDEVRTCVPQHVRATAEGETIRLFMRVRKPMKKVRLTVKSGDDTLLTKVLPVAKPSEMIAVNVPAEKAKGHHADWTVSVKEEA